MPDRYAHGAWPGEGGDDMKLKSIADATLTQAVDRLGIAGHTGALAENPEVPPNVPHVCTPDVSNLGFAFDRTPECRQQQRV